MAPIVISPKASDRADIKNCPASVSHAITVIDNGREDFLLVFIMYLTAHAKFPFEVFGPRVAEPACSLTLSYVIGYRRANLIRGVG